MSTKKPLVYVGIFAALAVLYYFYEYKGGEKRKETESLEKKALVFKADSVESFTVTSREKGAAVSATLTVRHSEAGWRITSPLDLPADSEAVSQLLKSAADAEQNRVVEDSAAEISIFGLDKPQLVFEVRPAGRDSSLKLVLGNKNPTESYIYAVHGSRPRRVILLNSWVLSDLNKSPADLRDKKVLHLDKNRVNRLVIEEKGRERLALGKTAGNWTMSLPLKVPADKDSVEGLLEELSKAEALRFIDTLAAGGYKAYGLEAPGLSVKVSEEEGEAVRTLDIGSADSSGNYFARRQGADNVYVIKKELVAGLGKDASLFRDRRLVRQNKEAVLSFSITSSGETVTAVKDTSGTWKLTSPDSARADGSSVDGFLYDLKDLKAAGFLDQVPPEVEKSLTTPFLEIAYRAADAENRLAFARVAPGVRDSLVYVRASDLPGVAAADSAAAARLVRTYQSLLYKKILDLDSDKITRISLEYPQQKIELRREKDDWLITSPQKMPAKTWKVQNILWDLTGMDFTKIISRTGEDTSRYGFQKPSLRVALWKKDSLAALISFADSLPGTDEIVLRRSGDKRIFAVEKRIFRGIPATLEELKQEETKK